MRGARGLGVALLWLVPFVHLARVEAQTCPGGSINAYEVCCPLSCGECGGSGCRSRPGGRHECCSGAVSESDVYCDESGSAPCIIGSRPTAQTCPGGIEGINANDVVCCPLSCGECGGAGCRSRPGGGDACCGGGVKDSDVYCDESGSAPCIIGSRQTCPGGIEGVASDANDVCCSLSCGECGGSGCRSRPGGGDACCGGGVKDSDVYCDESGSAPCIIGSRQKTDACNPNPCLNGGSCALDPAGGHICTCSSDAYAGMHCQLETDGLASYDIQVEYLGIWTDERKAVFESAASRLEEVITHTPCGAGINTISATIEYIDGPYGVLGSAGPTFVNTDCLGIALSGTMRFDTADIDHMETQGTLFEDVILHEMGHTMGVGTLWEPPFGGCSTCDSTGSPRWGCPALIEAYTDLLGDDAASTDATDIIELGGGSGTACGHLDEDIFQTELMTGIISADQDETPLSKLTAASLEDIGYLVDPSKVDSYTLPTGGEAGLKFGEDVLKLTGYLIDTTIGVVDENGDVTKKLPGVLIETRF